MGVQKQSQATRVSYMSARFWLHLNLVMILLYMQAFVSHACLFHSPFGDARHWCSVYLCVCVFAFVAEMISSIWLQGLESYGVTLRIGSEHCCCVWKYSKIGIDNPSNHNCTETPLGGPANLCSHRHRCTEEFKAYCSSS